MKKLDIIISHKYKFIWIGIPKVATRSFIDALIKNPKHDYGCEQFKLTLEELAEFVNLEDYFVFSFVRNPWARIVSCYLNKIDNPSDEIKEVIISKYRGISANMSFESFVDFLAIHKNGNDEKGNQHWVSQVSLLENKKGKMITNQIFKLEDLDGALNELSTILEMPKIEIPVLNTFQGWQNKKNANSQHKGKYKKMYNESTRDKISKRYAKDVELFNYQF